MSVNSLIGLTIVFVFNGLTEESKSGCDSQSMANLTIDSTVLIPEMNEIYFFSNWIVTEVDVTNEEITSQNITEAFDFKDRVKDFKPPVDLADIGYFGGQLVLKLVANVSPEFLLMKYHIISDHLSVDPMEYISDQS